MQPIRAAFLLLLLVLAGGAAAGDGVFAADTPSATPRVLEGDWLFIGGKFVDPQWTALPGGVPAKVPSPWNDLAVPGKQRGTTGAGSYVARVDCKPGDRLAVLPAAQRSAMRVYVNGTLIASQGEPGITPAEAVPMVATRLPISAEFPCPLRLTVQLSNFDHRAGGFVRPLTVGRADALAAIRETRIAQEAILLGALLLTAVVNLIFYAARREDRAPLWFGVFCLAMAAYGDITGERMLWRVGPAAIGWALSLRTEYLAWFATMASFALTLRGLFPEEIKQWAVRTVLLLTSLAAAVVLLAPPAVFTHLAAPGQALALAITAFIAVTMAFAAKRGRPGAPVLLWGIAAVLAAVLLDLAMDTFAGPSRRFTPWGIVLFVFSPAVVLARRLARAVNAEARTRALEENARLRDEVERMSRHDLKTPLNSIIGASRILRQDGRLAAEQRDLLDIVERAGWRMLELVNLSLGLFKMETGRYDFRPQAVNLDEVIARVLLDLHVLAEAGRVRVRLASAQSQPVYARAEELLCYSIVANLVKNAIEATPPGGTVTLDLQARESIELAVHNPGHVPAPVAERFFQKYVTAGKSGGTGLGAYSARLMARAQQGDLQMHTSPSAGTTLTLTLDPLRGEIPAASEAATFGPRPGVAVDAGSFAARRVLVVDDDEYNRLILRRYLPCPPFAVDTAANGHAAVVAMKKQWPDWLLIDMEMPVMNGLEAVAWAREHEREHGCKRCTILMLSSNDDAVSIAAGLSAGADRFLTKPLSQEALLAALCELDPTVAPGGGGVCAVIAAQDEQPDAVVRLDPDLADAIPQFLQSRRELADRMLHALSAGDREELRALAHRAAGGLALYGFEWAAEQSRRIELDAREGDAASLRTAVERLLAHLREVRTVATAP